MKIKVLKWQLFRGSIVRRVLLRTLLVALAITIFPFIKFSHNILPQNLLTKSNGCVFDFASNAFSYSGRFLKPMSAYAFPPLPSLLSVPCKERGNWTMDLFKELIDEKMLELNAKALCFGEGSDTAVSALQELGMTDVLGVKRHSFFSLMRKDFSHEIEFDDNAFDFVFSSDVSRVYVPAILVHEIERVLKPGGVGAMLVSAQGSLIKSATPVSAFLKSSDVVNVRRVRGFSLVVFKKKVEMVNPFEHYQLPETCPSIANNEVFMPHLEPLVDKNSVGIEDRFSYLPKFMNVSSRKRFIYVDIGAGEGMNSKTTNWFFKFYPLRSKLFDVYVVDHDTSVLSSYVKRPGVTFVYHPGLSANNATDGSEASEFDEGFHFLMWFRETVAAGDFMVLKMNAAGVELKLLHELFESGAICLVDELFLRCPIAVDGSGNTRADCVELFKGLRSSGVYVHQWLED